MKAQTNLPVDWEYNTMSAVTESRVVKVVETRSLLPIGWGNGAGKLIREYYTLEGDFIARIDVGTEED